MFGNKLSLFKSRKNIDVNKNDKKKIENLVFFVVILIVTIIAINVIWKDDKQSGSKEREDSNSKQLASTDEGINKDNKVLNNDLEGKLKNILQKMQGVGKVEVFVNYSESSETVAMYNENSKTSSTEETDTSGGKRVIEQKDTQKDIVYKEDSGDKVPITQKVVQPKIEGAIITAQGANNAVVKTNIIQAVEAATGLATHKIQVFEMEDM